MPLPFPLRDTVDNDIRSGYTSAAGKYRQHRSAHVGADLDAAARINRDSDIRDKVRDVDRLADCDRSSVHVYALHKEVE
jgi:hypothetical protein